MNRRLPPVVLAALIAACSLARAQWVTQRVPLHAGWNAVCLQVEPEAGTLEKVVAAVGEGNLAGIWRWNRSFEPAEFVVDEASPLARDPHWKVWYPGEELGTLSTLGGFSGGQSYLLKLREGAPAVTVAVKGRARLPRTEWYPNALNLVGFPVGTNGAAFDEWFEAASAVDLSRGYDNAVWQVAPDGTERVVSRPSAQKLAAGEAAWVRCNGATSYTGPLEVEAGAGAGLDFGEKLATMPLTVKNLSPTRARTLTLRAAASEEAPDGEEAVAGAVPLYLAEGDAWTPFAGKTVELGPGESWTGTFGVNRAEMERRTARDGDADRSYQSLLQVRDGEGKIAIDVPVRAVRAAAASPGEPLDTVDPSPHPQYGLWTGTAALAEVDCPSYKPGEPLPVRHAATLRLIVHVDGNGAVRLLNEAWVAEGEDGTATVYARRDLVPPAAADIWRASSATLPPMPPLPLGTNGLGGTLAATVELAFDDPVNPFLHRYHPLFDNKNGQFEPYDTPVETRGVSRELSLQVSEPDPAALADPDASVAGTYEERLTGLRAQPIVVRGTFRLDKLLAGDLVEAGE